MLRRGYINFFEGECCFVGIGRDSFFKKLSPGDTLRLVGDNTDVCLRASNGRITFDGAPDNIQGLAVMLDDQAL